MHFPGLIVSCILLDSYDGRSFPFSDEFEKRQ